MSEVDQPLEEEEETLTPETPDEEPEETEPEPDEGDPGGGDQDPPPDSTVETEIKEALTKDAVTLEGEITDNVSALFTSALAAIDPEYTNKSEAYRSMALDFITNNRAALIGMSWKTFESMLKVRARGGFTEAEKVKAYEGLTIQQLNLIQKGNVATIAAIADERVRQLAIYERTKQQLTDAASKLLIKGIATILV